MRLVLEAAARTDLREIRDYLEREAGRRVAKRVLERLRDRLRVLLMWPESGPARTSLGSGRRILVSRPYVAIYRVTADQIRVLRVLHGARDIEAVMNADE